MPRNLTPAERSSLMPATVCFDMGEEVPALVAIGNWNGWLMPIVTRHGFDTLMMEWDGVTVTEETGDTITIYSEQENVSRTYDLFTIDGREWVDLRDAGLCFNPGNCAKCEGEGVVTDGRRDENVCPACGGNGESGEWDHDTLLDYESLGDEPLS